MDILKLYKVLTEGTVGIFEDEMVDEMAMIVGDLETALRDAIEEYPDLQGNELKRAIKNDPVVKNALQGDKLHDNQLNRFIAKVQAEPAGAPRPAPRSAEPPPPRFIPRDQQPMDGEAPSSDGAASRQSSNRVSPSKQMDIISKLDAGATPEELASEYGLEVDDIIAIQSKSAAEDEGDVRDIEGLRGDGEFKPIELKMPEQNDRDVNAEVLAKAERSFYINPKADKDQVMMNLQAWAAKRNDKTDITKTQHPLRGASDEQVEAALNNAAKSLGAQRTASKKRLQSQQGTEIGDDGDSRRDSAGDFEGDFKHEESYEEFSKKTISEHMKTLKSTSTVRYPNQITFSEDFIKKLAEEFMNHTSINETRGVIRNIEEKMMKALKMHIHEISQEAKKMSQRPVKETNMPTMTAGKSAAKKEEPAFKPKFSIGKLPVKIKDDKIPKKRKFWGGRDVTDNPNFG